MDYLIISLSLFLVSAILIARGIQALRSKKLLVWKPKKLLEIILSLESLNARITGNEALKLGKQAFFLGLITLIIGFISLLKALSLF